MYSTPRPTKTYGRKLSMKDGSESTSFNGRQQDENTDDDEPPRKKRAVVEPSGVVNYSARNAARSSQSPERRIGHLQHSSRENATSLSGTSNQEADSPKSKGKGKEVAGNLDVIDIPIVSSVPQSSYSTPKKSSGPKDLSEIFNAVSPSPNSQIKSLQRTPSTKPSGLAKRMLARSRTESSIESSPKSHEDILPRHHSLAESPARTGMTLKAGPSRTLEEHESQESSQNSISESSGSQVKEAKNIRRTYAGHSRSFLLELPVSSVLEVGRNGTKSERLDDNDDTLRDSYSELRRRWGVDNPESGSVDASQADGEPTSTGEGLYNPLFSITDLRSKGETRRFMDEIGYLFEGLSPSSSLSVRRSSAFDIVSKLCDQKFWRKARAAGLIGEIWDHLRGAEAGNGDIVLDSILCCFVTLATEDPRDISPLAAKDDFVPTIVQLLEAHTKKDPFSLARAHSSSPQKRRGSNNEDMMMLNRLNDITGKMLNISREDCSASIRVLLSNVFSASPHLAFPHVAAILDSVTNDLSALSKRLTAYRSGLPFLPDAPLDSFCLYHIYNCLSILDSFLLNGQVTDDSQGGLTKSGLMTSYPDLEAGLMAVTVAMDILERTSTSDGMQMHASHCSELALRILINLTNEDPEWVSSVTADEYTFPTLLRLITSSSQTMLCIDMKKFAQEDGGEDIYTRAMDRLCLGLALLTNLAQESKELMGLLQATEHSTSCQGTRKCLSRCCCPNGVDAISILVNTYIFFLKIDGDTSNQVEADSTFLRGHLAVLLGLLILQGDPHPSAVIDKLPGDSPKARLRHLMQHITEFAALYKEVTSRCGGGGDEEEGRQTHASHTLENESISADVITNVVSSLAALQTKLS